MKELKRLPVVDYGEIGWPHPIPAIAMLVAMGLKKPEEAKREIELAIKAQRLKGGSQDVTE